MTDRAESFASDSGRATQKQFPVLISESVRSAFRADASNTQGIVSVLLSGADLAKLDISRLQLFSVDGLALHPAPCTVDSQEQTDVGVPDEEFTFQTPLVLSSMSEFPAGLSAFPILKSRGVVEAQNANAEHHMLKIGAVSPSPRARKKAISMDEISLSEQLKKLDDTTVEKTSWKTYSTEAGIRGRRQLPELELPPSFDHYAGQWTPSPHLGLEMKAEKLKNKHVERVLNRKLGEVTSENIRIDLQSSPAGKFLLQVMPWELTPSVTPTTPAAVPFIWEDAPGHPKRQLLPSPRLSLPLPPRLVASQIPFSIPEAYDSRSSFNSTDTFCADQKSSVVSVSKSGHGGRRRRKTNSWHFLPNFYPGNNPQCSSQVIDTYEDTEKTANHLPLSRTEDPSFRMDKLDADSILSKSVRFSSSDLPPSISSASLETELSRNSSFCSRECSKLRRKPSYLIKFLYRTRSQKRELSRALLLFNCFRRQCKVTSNRSSSNMDDRKAV
ncbi:hypothetical protein KP509_34G026300 [Ceratopteris richardii]|uniref:Uncharacterized protein n=1 Tax=Ceratopteris richardii TaxID=49495 RepID=A0A8T2QKR1_CERRI|nr:hypothetical protein KP509_34G026300 [Ceratopteris richardii]KAH7283841.1 hypothetical protein KP509_34G026300 [Ceratopteris richardii]